MQQPAFKATCCLILLTIYLNAVQCIDRKNNNHDTQSDNQDNNSDATDSSYDQSGSPESPDDNGETSSLPPPHYLSVIRLNDTSVVLRWEIPDAYQDRLQFFKIQYKYSRKNSEWRTENREIPATTRAYQINGLRPGNFFFIVIAVYDNDDNVPSEPFKYRLRARSKLSADDMPEMKAPVIHWKEAKSDYFRFKWTYVPKVKDMEYFGYLVYYRSAHVVSDFTIYNTLDENVEIAEVEPNTPYEAKVVAYNQNGISEFSDTITIKTEPRPNSTAEAITTTTTLPSATSTITTTTKRPLPSSSSRPSSNYESISTSTMAPPSVTTTSERYSTTMSPTGQTTQKPIIIGPTHTSTTTNSTFQSYMSMIEQILRDQSDTTLIIRYLLLVLLPIVFIVLVLICLLSRHRGNHKSSPPSSTDESMQFDLEINGYFKNSFPGVEKEYSSVTNHSAHHGFVNNHPHISEFA